MAAGTLEDHLVAVAAGRLVDDAADAEPVDRDEAVDVLVVAEQRLDAARDCRALPRRRCRRTGGRRRSRCRCSLIALTSDSSAARPRESSPIPGALMTPSFSFTVTSTPSGNTVSRCADTTSFGRPPPLPLRSAIDIAFAVDGRVVEAEFLHPLQIIFGAHLFLEGRRRNFGDALLLFQRARIVGLDVVERLDDFGIGEQRLQRRRPLRSTVPAQAPAQRSAATLPQIDALAKPSWQPPRPAAKPISFSRPANQSDSSRSMMPPR